MKEYKRMYCTSLVCMWVEIFIMMLPSIFVSDIALWYLGYEALGSALLGVVSVFVLIEALSFIFASFITLLINVFKKPSVFVGETTITHMGQTLYLHAVKYLTLYLPEMRSRTSWSTQELSIYTDAKEHIVIKRPSIALIAHLKKSCTNAEFEIDELKSRLKTDLLIGLCGLAIFAVAFYISGRQ